MNNLIFAFALSLQAGSPGPAILEGINDERFAIASYEAAMVRFGQVPPFRNIVRAERIHLGLLESLAKKYSVEVPADPHTRKPSETGKDFVARLKIMATRVEACRVFHKAEVDNAGLYARLLKGQLPIDVRTTFEKLRDDSQLRHRVAFARCAGIRE